MHYTHKTASRCVRSERQEGRGEVDGVSVCNLNPKVNGNIAVDGQIVVKARILGKETKILFLC
jgi:hypothetical protein